MNNRILLIMLVIFWIFAPVHAQNIVISHEVLGTYNLINIENTNYFYFLEDSIRFYVSFDGVVASYFPKDKVYVSPSYLNYEEKFLCEYQDSLSDATKVVFLCETPRLSGVFSSSLFYEGVYGFDVLIDFDYEGTSRSAIQSIEVPFDISQKPLEMAVSNIEITSPLIIGAKAYSSYCILDYLSKDVEFYVNISTNYLVPENIDLGVDKITISDFNAEPKTYDVYASCSVKKIYNEDSIIEYECSLDDIYFDGKLMRCSDSALLEGAIVPLDVKGSIYYGLENQDKQEYVFDYEAYADIYAVLSEIPYTLDVSFETDLMCNNYDGSIYCYFGDEYSLKPLSFKMKLIGPKEDDVVLLDQMRIGIGDSYFANGIMNYGSCEYVGREGLEVEYECNYYLPVIPITDGTIYVEPIFMINDNPYYVYYENSLSFTLNDLENSVFYFVSNSSFDEKAYIDYKIGPTDENGNIVCEVDENNICHFGVVDSQLDGLEEATSPLYFVLEGYVFLPFEDLIHFKNNDGDEVVKLFDLTINVYDLSYDIGIYSEDCEISDFTTFKGLYRLSCNVDLSEHINEIPYDPKNPPVFDYVVSYGYGVYEGEYLFSLSMNVFPTLESLMERTTLKFSIVSLGMPKQDLLYSLAPGESTNYPVCRVPLEVVKMMDSAPECSDFGEDLTELADALECLSTRTSILDALTENQGACRFTTGSLDFYGIIDGIDNKEAFDISEITFSLGSYGNLNTLSNPIKGCFKKEGDSLVPCDENKVYTGTSCYLFDEGVEHQYKIICSFTQGLEYALDLAYIPEYYSIKTLPVYVSVIAEDNGWTKNGTDKHDFTFIIENPYATLTSKLNSLKQQEEYIDQKISDVNGVYRRMTAVALALTGLDVAFGVKYRDPVIGGLLPTPGACVVGCIGCIGLHLPGYGACVGSARAGLPGVFTPHPMSCAMGCNTGFDYAWTCTTAGYLLIGSSLKPKLDKLKDEWADATVKVIEVESKLQTEYGDGSDMSTYTYEQIRKDLEESLVSGGVARTMETQLFYEVPTWIEMLVGAGYGAVCSVGYFDGFVAPAAGGISLSSLGSAFAIGAGTNAIMQYVYKGDVSLTDVVLAGGASSLTYGVGAGSMSLGGEALTKVITLTSTTYNLLTTYTSTEGSFWNKFAFLAGNAFFSTGIQTSIYSTYYVAQSVYDAVKYQTNEDYAKSQMKSAIEQAEAIVEQYDSSIESWDISQDIKDKYASVKEMLDYLKSEGYYTIDPNGNIVVEKTLLYNKYAYFNNQINSLITSLPPLPTTMPSTPTQTDVYVEAPSMA